MTFEEAKKILKKEFVVILFHKTTEPFEFDDSKWFGCEKPSVLEAFHVLAKEGYYITISLADYNEREKRLKKEYEKNTKAPGPGEEQPKEDNHALKEAASQFNDALLDEQGKKIESLTEKCKKYACVVDSLEDKLRKLKEENGRIKNSDLNLEGLIFANRELREKGKNIVELTNENERLKDQVAILDAYKKHNDKIARKQIKRLGKEIARLNGIIHDKNEELKRKTKGCCELVTENVDLEKKLSDKDAVLSDIAEELRLTKIREKNLAELGLKYVVENEKLKKELADKVVDKINTQALKSAESALAEKDEVIDDLGKELKAKKDLVDDISLKYDGAKHNLKVRTEGLEKLQKVLEKLQKVLEKLQKELEEKTKLIEVVRNASKEYCDYGVAANEFIKELADLYVLASNNNVFNIEMVERCKNYQTYGFPANCDRETKKEINDIASGKENKKPRIPTPETPKHGNSREDFIKKTIDSFNIRYANLGCAGSKDGNGIFDQMIGVDKAEEGGDHSGKIVLCGKDFGKILKENEEAAEELSKVLDDIIDQFLIFGEIIIKE